MEGTIARLDLHPSLSRTSFSQECARDDFRFTERRPLLPASKMQSLERYRTLQPTFAGVERPSLVALDLSRDCVSCPFHIFNPNPVTIPANMGCSGAYPQDVANGCLC